MKIFLFMTAAVLSVSAGGVTNDFLAGPESEQGISFYKPNYAVIGADPIWESELQFSFKYRFAAGAPFENWWSKSANNLYFAYTQTMFWDLEEDSAPYPNGYLDSYFSPEFFWALGDMFPGEGAAQFDLQFGYQHESNGRDGTYGRTWDRIYLQPQWIWGDTGSWQTALQLKLWAPVNVGGQMGDISDYYGTGELRLKTGRHNGAAAEVMLRKGSADFNGAVEVTASYPVRPVSLFIYGQVFYGYGENLRRYDEETFSYRIGLALSR